MHTYKISINGGCNVKDPLIYCFSNTKGIELHVKRNKASIIFQMGVEKTQEQMLTFTVPVWKDAYRKVFLVHALLFDQDLDVRKLIISIDDNAVEYDASTEGFPFIYSMISKDPMNLPESWKTREFLQSIVSKTKSKGNLDLTQISVMAFLASKGRGFEIDRFTNLWTSMNAYYNWFGELYNSYFREKYLYDKELCNKLLNKLRKADTESKRISDLIQLRDESPNKAALITGDAPCMGFLIQSIDPMGKKIGSHIKESSKRHTRYDIEQYVSELSMEQLSELYEYALELLNGRTITDKDPYANLALQADSLGQELYFYLVFELPYYCRCNYIHGSKALLLLAYKNEYEIKVLRNAGYFVERFLTDRIPDMVTGKTTLPEYLKDAQDKSIEGKKPSKEANDHKNRMEKALAR